MKSINQTLLQETLRIAAQSKQNGNLPYGCLLADENGNILMKGENSIVTSGDSIAHAELNLVHQLSGKFDCEFLKKCTVYASKEPCPMCTGALYWSGVGRVVYALSTKSYRQAMPPADPDYIFDTPIRDVLKHAGRAMLVEGPLLEEEAMEFYKKVL